MENYHPKYLKPEPVKGQDAEDAEAFALVHGNHSRKVDAEALPPIVLEDDGTMTFMEPEPVAGNRWGALWAVITLCVLTLAGVAGAVYVLATKTITFGAAGCCTVGLAALALIFNMMGGNQNAGR